MAQELYRNYQNIKWRLENITPTASQHGIRSNFYHIENDEKGTSRAFQILFLSGSMGTEINNQKYRDTDYIFNVQVYYENMPKRDMSFVIILNDLHDICWALENESNWVGYNDDNPTDYIRLLNRTITKSSIIESEKHIALNIEIICNIQEENF